MRLTTIIAAASTCLALAACGSTAATTTTATATATKTTIAAPVAPPQTPQQAGTGYFDMSTLQDDLTTQVDKKISSGGSTVDITCISSGGLTAVCHGTYSDGEQETVIVNISPDGLTYITANN